MRSWVLVGGELIELDGRRRVELAARRAVREGVRRLEVLTGELPTLTRSGRWLRLHVTSSRRSNPARIGQELLDSAVWHPLRRSGKLNAKVRELVRGKTGVYVIRETHTDRDPYVGECSVPIGSEVRAKGKGKGKGSGVTDLRMWKTLVRHAYEWRVLTQQSIRWREANRPDEWVSDVESEDLDVALYFCEPRNAKRREAEVILGFGAVSNKVIEADLEEVPF